MKLNELLQESGYIMKDPAAVRAWLARASGHHAHDALFNHLCEVDDEGYVINFPSKPKLVLTFTDKYLPIRFKALTNVEINNPNLETLEGFPEEIHGDFSCVASSLKTLQGGPKRVHGSFDISKNKKLKTLEGGPTHVDGDYKCHKCGLVNLQGAPERVIGDFVCSDNKKLKSLEGAPSDCGDTFYCLRCDLTSLKGAPDFVMSFNCSGNPNLTSLEGAPKHIEHSMTADDCGEMSLVGIEKIIESVESLSVGVVTDGGIGAVHIRALTSISFVTPDGDITPSEIIMDFLERPDDIFECQTELIDQGYEEYAKL